jgi:hypothetical protein
MVCAFRQSAPLLGLSAILETDDRMIALEKLDDLLAMEVCRTYPGCV